MSDAIARRKRERSRNSQPSRPRSATRTRRKPDDTTPRSGSLRGRGNKPDDTTPRSGSIRGRGARPNTSVSPPRKGSNGRTRPSGSSLKQQLQESEHQMEELKEEKISLEGRLQELEDERARLEGFNQDLQIQLDLLRDQTDELEQLRETNAALQEQLEAEQEQETQLKADLGQQNEDTTSLRRELESIRAQLLATKTECDHLRTDANRGQRLQEENRRLLRDIEDLKSRPPTLDTRSDQSGSDVSVISLDTTTELNRLQTELMAERQVKTRLQEEVHTLKGKLDTVETDVRARKMEADRFSSMKETLHNQLIAVREQCKTLQRDIDVMHAQMRKNAKKRRSTFFTRQQQENDVENSTCSIRC